MQANTAAEAREIALDSGVNLANMISDRAAEFARSVVSGAPIVLNILIVDRDGHVLAETDYA